MSTHLLGMRLHLAGAASIARCGIRGMSALPFGGRRPNARKGDNAQNWLICPFSQDGYFTVQPSKFGDQVIGRSEELAAFRCQTGPAAAAGRAACLAIAMRTSSCSPVVTGTCAKGTAEIACASYGLRL
jgi:hypothetical protein